MKQSGETEQEGCGEQLKTRILHMLAHKFLCNVNDTRALVGLCLLLTSHLGQIWDPWYSQAFTIAQIVIGLLLHIHIFIHLSHNSLMLAVAKSSLTILGKSFRQNTKSGKYLKGKYLGKHYQRLIYFAILFLIPKISSKYQRFKQQFPEELLSINGFNSSFWKMTHYTLFIQR